MTQTPHWALAEIQEAKASHATELWLLGIGESGPKLTELPPELFELPQLESLDLRYNDLKTLPASLSTLPNLHTIDLRDNPLQQVADLPGLILDFETWQQLAASLSPAHIKGLRLKLKEGDPLPSQLSILSRLTALDLSDNQLSQFPPEIVQLTNLQILNLGSNQLSQLPPEIGQLNNLKSLNLRGNRLEIPPEVLDLDSEGRANLTKLRAYFAEELVRLYEAKILIVGEAWAGKTTLTRKIQNPQADLPEENDSTQGIEIARWSCQIEGQAFQVNLWDFGGQEIYHATHQFFLTHRSLYVLVADNRKEDTDFNYWLNVVELLSNNSPVLILNNKRAGRKRKIDQRALQSRFSNLKEVLVSNLATDQELREIYRQLKHHLSGLPHIGTPLPKSWVRVRRVLEDSPDNYITKQQFETICREQGYRSDSQILLEVLHDLGICLHFKDDLLLQKWVILNPTWGTDAVYRVLDNERVIDQQGRFSNTDLNRIWHEAKYAAMQAALLQLMINFQLCYEIPTQKGHYIAPQLLSEVQPSYPWPEADTLKLHYRYEFMPKGIITRFIVAVHRLIARDAWVWRSGVILAQDSTGAEVIEHYTQSPRITVRVRGKNKRGLLEVIRHELGQIHASFPKLAVEEMVPCICADCRARKEPDQPEYYLFNTLLDFVADRATQIQCRKSRHMVDVLQLTDGIVSRTAVMEEVKRRHGGDRERMMHIENYHYHQETNMQSTTITHSTGVAVGKNNQAVVSSGSGHAAGGPQLIRQTVESDHLLTALQALQQQVAAQIAAKPDTPADEKADMTEELQQMVSEIEAKVKQQAEIRPGWIARRLNNIGNMGDDIVELIATMLPNPLAGGGLILKKVGQKIEVKKAEAAVG